MVLTSAQIVYITDAAWFNFYIEPRTVDTSGIGITGYFGNDFNMTGEGAVDLDKVTANLVRWPQAYLWLDVGMKGYPVFIRVWADDVAALRASFVAKYGDVVKPNVWNENLAGVAPWDGP